MPCVVCGNQVFNAVTTLIKKQRKRRRGSSNVRWTLHIATVASRRDGAMRAPFTDIDFVVVIAARIGLYIFTPALDTHIAFM